MGGCCHDFLMLSNLRMLKSFTQNCAVLQQSLHKPVQDIIVLIIIRLYMFICAFICEGTHGRVYTRTWRIEVNIGCLLLLLSTLFLRLGSYMNLALSDLAKLSGQQVLKIVLSSPPKCWDYGCIPGLL